MSNSTGLQGQAAFVGSGGSPTIMAGGGSFATRDGPATLLNYTMQYRYCGNAVAPVATPTDFIVMQGSATKTCRIRRIYIGGAATAAGTFPVQIIRRLSTGGTVGSAVLTAVTAGYTDLGATGVGVGVVTTAPTAVVSTVGTANFGTVQTANGVLGAGRVGLVALTAAAVYAPYILEPEKSLILRGASDYIMINFQGGAVPSGGVIDFEIVMEEDAS